MFNIFSIILLIILFFISIKSIANPKKLFLNIFTFYILFKISVNVGYFIKISNFEIFYDEIIELYLFFISIICIFNYRFDKLIVLSFLMLLIVLVLPSILNKFLDYNVFGISYSNSWDEFFYNGLSINDLELLSTNFRSILFIIRIFLFTIIVITFFINFNLKWLLSFSKLVNILSIFLLILFFSELILKNVFKSSTLNEMYLHFFGFGSSTKVGLGDSKFNIYQPICLYREQSFIGINFSILSIIQQLLWWIRKKKLTIICSLLLMLSAISSLSLTSVLYLILYAIILTHFMYKNSKTKYKYLFTTIVIFFSIIIISIILVLFNERIFNSIKIITDIGNIKQFGVSSEAIRIYSIVYNMGIFIKYPFFGIGLGVSQSYSAISSILVSIGIIGSIAYFLFWNRLYKIYFKKNIFLLCFILIIPFLFSSGIEILYSETLVILTICFIFAGQSIYVRNT